MDLLFVVGGLVLLNTFVVFLIVQLSHCLFQYSPLCFGSLWLLLCLPAYNYVFVIA